MKVRLSFVFALLFALVRTENLVENQVLESEKPDSTKVLDSSETSENTQISDNGASDLKKDKVNLSDLLFEYLDENTKKDVSETGK